MWVKIGQASVRKKWMGKCVCFVLLCDELLQNLTATTAFLSYTVFFGSGI